LRAARRDLHDGDGGVGEHGVKGCGELPGAVADQEPELGWTVPEVGDHVAGLLVVTADDHGRALYDTSRAAITGTTTPAPSAAAITLAKNVAARI
jgi:hypothetical protein